MDNLGAAAAALKLPSPNKPHSPECCIWDYYRLIGRSLENIESTEMQWDRFLLKSAGNSSAKLYLSGQRGVGREG